MRVERLGKAGTFRSPVGGAIGTSVAGGSAVGGAGDTAVAGGSAVGAAQSTYPDVER